MSRTAYYTFALFLLVSLLTPAFIFSQTIPNTAIGKISISSPNAASLGKFGDVPVCMHTGIPNIDIPVYDVKSGPLELPISMSYHASGLKVQEQASWVGAGWALNAGGVITRSVIGAPDDRGLNSAATLKGHFSDFGYNSYLFSAGPIGCSMTTGDEQVFCPSGTTFAPQDTYIQSGVFDGEPDLYFFNFNGHSGKFYFNDDRTPIITPEQDLKITPIYTGEDWRGMTGFIITTSDGIKYFFGEHTNVGDSVDAIEITYNVSTRSSFTGQGAVSAWYLNKIVSPDNEFTISLFYQAESYSYYTLSMYPIPGESNPNFYAYNHEYDLNKIFINGVRLTKITFPNGEVDFNGGSLRQDLSLGLPSNGLIDLANDNSELGGRTLGEIAIHSADFCKKYSLFYSYFFDDNDLTGDLFTLSYPQFNLHTDQYRLRLDSMVEQSCDSVGQLKLPPYKFSYYSGTVARKLSFGIDHWGFYNGVNTNVNLIPAYTIVPPSAMAGQVTQVDGADRDTHWPNSRNGTLQQITYPTGGNSSFVYEANSVYTSQSTYSKTLVATFTVGYDSPDPYTGPGFTTDASSNTYELDMKSDQATDETGGNLIFTNDGGNYSVDAGKLASYYFTLSPSTSYTATLYDHNNGVVTASLYELIPTTVNINTDIGGTRIKTVTSSDNLTAADNVKSYAYNYDNNPTGQSSGVLFSKPVYVQAMRNDAWALVNGSSCSSIGCLVCFGGASYYQSPSSIRPMASTQGNHVGYGEVYVSQTGNGSSAYKYYGNNGQIPHPWDGPLQDVCVRSLTTFCDPSIANSPAPPVPFDPMRGELAYEAHYDESGNLLTSKNYIPLYETDPIGTPGIVGNFFVTGYIYEGATVPALLVIDPTLLASGGFVPIGINTFTEYSLQSAKKIRDSVVTRNYDPSTGNSVTEISAVYYASPYHHAPTSKISISSKGEYLTTRVSNSFDFRISNFNVADQLNDYNVNIDNDNSNVTDALSSTSSSSPSYFWDRLNIYTNYRYQKTLHRQAYITYRRQTFTDPGNIYSTDHDVAIAAADGLLKPILQLQDNYINSPIEMSAWRGSNLTKALFTKYGFVSEPAGFAYPVKERFIHLAAPSNTFVPASVSGNSLSTDSRYADENTVNYSLGNVTEVTPKTSGYTTAYIWDYQKSKPIAKVINATSGQIAYSSFESDGNGNWTIPSASRDVTTPAITGKASYLLSSGDIVYTGTSPAISYVVSYWSTGGSYSVSGSTALKQGRSVVLGETTWTYFEHTVTNVTSITISGSSNIDELRLYPSNAFMTTYTYQPVLGITSECDQANIITYYRYDVLGRLNLVTDQNNNIIKRVDYQYQQP